MKIDIFPHVIPVKYKEALYKLTASDHRPPGRREVDKIEALPSLFDLDVRFRGMDTVAGLKQVLTPGAPPLEYVLHRRMRWTWPAWPTMSWLSW
jgi:hypothetical protein